MTPMHKINNKELRMPNTISISWLLFLALVGTLAIAACGGGDGPENVTFDLRIADRGIVGSEPKMEVKQDDEVTFNILSDEKASFHLHGYDHELELEPTVTGSVTFTADIAGSFPITIHAGAESGGDDHHAKTIEAPPGMSVSVAAAPDDESGANLSIATTGLTFAPDMVDQPHVPGEGHAHVYVDGVKLGRVFANDHYISDLDPGERTIRITLNANSHEQYAMGGLPVEATTTVVIPGEAKEITDDQDSASEPTEIDLGRLIVLPR